MNVWPLSLALLSAPHVTHRLRSSMDQDRKRVKRKVFTTINTDAANNVWREDPAGICFVLVHMNRTILTTQTLQIGTPGADLGPVIMAYVIILIYLNSSPHGADICERRPSVSNFTPR